MNDRRAFTLIEILVVVAIIGVLVGILAPSLASARRQARLTLCGTHLSQMGKAIIAYMQDSRDRMPHVSQMPSISPAPLDLNKPAIWFADVLSPQIRGEKDVLQCPEDRPNFTQRPSPNTGKSFYQSERSSYEYRVRLAGLAPTEFGREIGEFLERRSGQPVGSIPANTIWICRDYDNFHSTKFIVNPVDDTQRPVGGQGARRFLYIDGHVTDFEQY